MSAPTPSEKKLIIMLREQINDINLYDDSEMFLIRWIRAREHNLIEAENMLRKHIQWYEENDIASVERSELSEEFKRAYPTYILGRDLENSTVAVFPYGKWQIQNLYNYKDEFLRLIPIFNKTSTSMMKGRFTSSGVPASQHIHIVDCEGLSLRHLSSFTSIQVYLEGCRSSEANYPELIKTTYIINASRIFVLCFNLVKPALSQQTLDKFTIFGCDSSKWMPVLQKAIPLEILPEKYGGHNPIEI